MSITHTYLGLHVLSRGIIFVDLALAQVAALGVSIAFLLGEDGHGVSAQVYALSATLLAAFLFAKLRNLPNKTTREVTIGCVYVVATALSIVILSRSSKGMDELKSIFNGNILWVSWEEITIIALIYAALSVIHYIYHSRFIALSFDSDGDRPPGFIWEFLFFASFAVVITLAVNVAGILLVFAFLIIPAFSASIISNALIHRLLFGWLLGIAGCVVGLWVAFQADLPVGATVVSVLGVLPLVALIIKRLSKKMSVTL